MKMKRMVTVSLAVIFFIFFVSILFYGQEQPPDQKPGSGKEFWIPIIVTLVVGLGLGEALRALFKFIKKKKINLSLARTARGKYRAYLKEKYGHIDLLGSPDIDNKPVKLEDAFVSLCISEAWRSDKRFENAREMETLQNHRHLTPEQVMKRAFQHFRLLLVIGDPGSGKTTLLKYYALRCLDRKHRSLGFKKKILPIYFPLREWEFTRPDSGDNARQEPVKLPHILAAWAERHSLDIEESQFDRWLQDRKTLVLLDGLDEISSKETRKEVCRWLENICAGFANACFVMTSRATGYRKLDDIKIEMPHLRADIMDFSPHLQETFLRKWFKAVNLSELPPPDKSETVWRLKQERDAREQADVIVDYLKKEENKALRDLAAVPMLLQIMAIMWKNQQFLPENRLVLYDTALNYLLTHRDRRRKIEPLCPARESRRVLAPTALWMQEVLKTDEVRKQEMHGYMQEKLDTLGGQPEASEFCGYLRDRAGLLADYDKNHYIFRHKSFREFLAGTRLIEEAHRSGRMEKLISCFKDDWWEEPLRFFMSEADENIFDRFMELFFQSPVSKELNDHQQNLLRHLIKDAPQKKIDALAAALNSGALNDNQERYAMDCLKTIGTLGALEAISAFVEQNGEEEANLDYARDIMWEFNREAAKKQDTSRRDSFRNPFEDDVEYIKIPGATYKYSVTGEMETVPDLYFCKYPVTNKRYRRFISYLAGKEKELVLMMPLGKFAERLLKFSKSIKGFPGYLGDNPNEWHGKLRSGYDDDKRYNGDDQPVVGVTWFAARSYCFWLSCLEAVKRGDIKELTNLYRLPTEVEWEWAAGSEPDGSLRTYPWPKEKGTPSPNLANYNKNVGVTTPVGRYPEGATASGLMDMAGNVWEWMENLYSNGTEYRALRGGSWNYNAFTLRCSARYYYAPGNSWSDDGFRVAASPQS